MGTRRHRNRVTVLNASYEPISTTRLARAIVWIQNGKAEIETAVPGRYVKSTAGIIPVPKVVRLVQWVEKVVKHLYGPAKWTKQNVLLRDKNVCVYCGNKATTVDHLTPKSRGGKNTWSNTAASCKPCNNRKDDRTAAEFGYGNKIRAWTPTVAELRSLSAGMPVRASMSV